MNLQDVCLFLPICLDDWLDPFLLGKLASIYLLAMLDLLQVVYAGLREILNYSS